MFLSNLGTEGECVPVAPVGHTLQGVSESLTQTWSRETSKARRTRLGTQGGALEWLPQATHCILLPCPGPGAHSCRGWGPVLGGYACHHGPQAALTFSSRFCPPLALGVPAPCPNGAAAHSRLVRRLSYVNLWLLGPWLLCILLGAEPRSGPQGPSPETLGRF